MKTKKNVLTSIKTKSTKKIKSLDQSIQDLGIVKVEEYEKIIKYF